MSKQSALAFANHLVATMADASVRWPDLTESEIQWAAKRARGILEHRAKQAERDADLLQRMIGAKERQERDEELVR
jgi:hypothetical protein